MCGIAGIIRPDSLKADRKILKQMCDSLIRRGPDDSGYYTYDEFGIGMRRLKIIDIEGGHQPMISENGRYVIVFNGEVYNYIEIRRKLIQKGRIFKTRSDTEVVLQAFEEYGEKSIQEFRGMFSFAILDRYERRCVIVRDRLGIKPLFYYRDEEMLLFASEMKAILPYCSKLTLNHEAIANYLTFAYIPAPMTIYNEVKKLEPGRILEYKNSEVVIRRYWNLNFTPELEQKSEEELIYDFEKILMESLQLRLRSDVPVGAFLSGGLDSGLIVALLSKASSKKVDTFTIGFVGNTRDDEREYAREIADMYQTTHHEFELNPQMTHLIPDIIAAFDEPFGDVSTIPTYMVSKMASKHVTVALSGLGGDEILAGYERYVGYLLANKVGNLLPHQIPLTLQKLLMLIPEPAHGNNRIHHAKRFVRSLSYNHSERYLNIIALLSEDMIGTVTKIDGRKSFSAIKKRFERIFLNGGTRDALSCALYADTAQYLPDDILCNTDRLSMWHSLEVRVPYLDHKLVEYCAKIPTNLKIKGMKKKYLLKKVAAKYLPEKTVHRRKRGFTCPMSEWLKKDLRNMCYDILESGKIKQEGIFDANKINEILQAHFSGRAMNDTLIWSLLIFECWFQSRFQHRP